MAAHGETLTSYLSSGSTASALMTATTALLEPIRKEFQEEGKAASEVDFWGLWSEIIHAAREAASSRDTAQQHAALIALLAHIKASGPLIRDRDHAVCYSDGGVAWSDLPCFGASMREDWNKAPPDASAKEWEAINGFAARCTAAGVEDFTLYGLWALRDALETPQPKGALADVIPAAVAWIEVYGAGLAKHVQEGKTYAKGDKSGDPGRPGRLAKEAGVEDSGFTQSRWQFWLKRLTEISSIKDEVGGHEQVAKEAHVGLLKMQALDRMVQAAAAAGQP